MSEQRGHRRIWSHLEESQDFVWELQRHPAIWRDGTPRQHVRPGVLVRNWEDGVGEQRKTWKWLQQKNGEPSPR